MRSLHISLICRKIFFVHLSHGLITFWQTFSYIMIIWNWISLKYFRFMYFYSTMPGHWWWLREYKEQSILRWQCLVQRQITFWFSLMFIMVAFILIEFSASLQQHLNEFFAFLLSHTFYLNIITRNMRTLWNTLCIYFYIVL